MATAQTFHLFRELAPELRNIIWDFVVPIMYGKKKRVCFVRLETDDITADNAYLETLCSSRPPRGHPKDLEGPVHNLLVTCRESRSAVWRSWHAGNLVQIYPENDYERQEALQRAVLPPPLPPREFDFPGGRQGVDPDCILDFRPYFDMPRRVIPMPHLQLVNDTDLFILPRNMIERNHTMPYARTRPTLQLPVQKVRYIGLPITLDDLRNPRNEGGQTAMRIVTWRFHPDVFFFILDPTEVESMEPTSDRFFQTMVNTVPSRTVPGPIQTIGTWNGSKHKLFSRLYKGRQNSEQVCKDFPTSFWHGKREYFLLESEAFTKALPLLVHQSMLRAANTHEDAAQHGLISLFGIHDCAFLCCRDRVDAHPVAWRFMTWRDWE